MSRRSRLRAYQQSRGYNCGHSRLPGGAAPGRASVAPVFQRIAQQVLDTCTCRTICLAANRQVWLAQNRVKDSDLDEGSPDRLGSPLEAADSAPDTTPLPPQPKPSAAQASVVPAALRVKSSHQASLRRNFGKADPPAPGPTNSTVVLDVEQAASKCPRSSARAFALPSRRRRTAVSN